MIYVTSNKNTLKPLLAAGKVFYDPDNGIGAHITYHLGHITCDIMPLRPRSHYCIYHILINKIFGGKHFSHVHLLVGQVFMDHTSWIPALTTSHKSVMTCGQSCRKYISHHDICG